MAEIITDEAAIQRIYVDPGTGLKIAEDRLGRWHLLTLESADETEGVSTPLTLQASVSSPWANDNDFNIIPGMSYIVPSGKTLVLDYIIAASDKEFSNILGVYINNVLDSTLPFGNSLNFNYSVPPSYNTSTKVELRFKPPVKRTKLTVTMGGRIKQV